MGGWGRPLPKMGEARASRVGCPGPQGGPAGGGQAGAAAHPAHVAEPQAGPGGRECRAGWKKALEAERRCLCWQLAEAPPAFHSPPFPSLAAPLPSLKSQKPGGRPAEHFVSGASERLASPAKPQVQVGRWVGDMQPSDGAGGQGPSTGCAVTVSVCHWLLPPGPAALPTPYLVRTQAHQSPGRPVTPLQARWPLPAALHASRPPQGPAVSEAPTGL